MQIFNISVENKDKVKTRPDVYHVPGHRNEDFIYTMDPSNEDEYDLQQIDITGAAFTRTRVNRKTILMHDDNERYWEEGDTPYKYTVRVKPVNGGRPLEDDPTIVNQ